MNTLGRSEIYVSGGTEYARPGDGYYVGLAASSAQDTHRGAREQAGEKDVGSLFFISFAITNHLGL